MRRAGGLVLATLVACSELKNAEPPPDAGPPVDAPDVAPSDADAGTPTAADGGADAGRRPCAEPCTPELLFARASLGALAVDDTSIYFSSPTSGAISRCPKAGCVGNPAGIADVITHRLALAGGKVWWGNEDKQQLQSCAVGGCNDVPETVLANQLSISEVVTDGSTIAWSVRVTDGAIIRSCPVSHCADTVTDVVKVPALATGMAAAGGTLWYANSVSNQVVTCPIASGCTTPNVLGAGDFGIVIAPPSAYWIKDKGIVQCALLGCDTLPTIAAMSDGPGHLAVDERDIYWRDASSKKILRCPRTGCAEPEVIAEGIVASVFMTIQLDTDYVYWTDNRGVWRRQK